MEPEQIKLNFEGEENYLDINEITKVSIAFTGKNGQEVAKNINQFIKEIRK